MGILGIGLTLSVQHKQDLGISVSYSVKQSADC